MGMDSRRKVLLIAYSKEIVGGEPIYVSSNALPSKAQKLEPAGHAFHEAALRLAGHVTDKAEDGVKDVSDAKENIYIESSDSYSSKSKKKSSGEAKQQDHYALLGLSHLRYLASEDQIRKCYREAALRHHPDKQAALLLAEETEAAKDAKKDEIDSHFKAIQEAYGVLMDPARRRLYDSTDEFDDEIPSDCTPQEFFKVFGPAFLRNGRWSVTQPVPMLGDYKTGIEEVDSFYDFWYNYKTWREFPHDDEYDLEQAESRDHKRWMERQNAKLSEKARKEEYVRIRTLVDNAYRRDPRILRRKEELKAEKQRKKEAKLLAKKMLEAEAARIAEEQRLRKVEEEKKTAEAALNQKKLREKEKKLLRKERTRLRSLALPILSDHIFDITDDDVDGLCSALDKEQLKNLCDQIEGKESLEGAELLIEALPSDKKTNIEDTNSKKNVSIPINGEVAFSSFQRKEKPWSKEEIELLRKGMLKYPKGTSRRWEVISEYIGTERSVEEILKATKTVLLQKPDSAKAFDSFLEKRKPAQPIASPLSSREEITSQNNVSESECQSLGSDPMQKKSYGNGVIPNLDKSDKPLSNGVSSSSDEISWSATQERALVQALKAVPKETAQRWERVAAAVPGKTEVQCKKKFALMRDTFKKNSTAPEKKDTHSGNSQESCTCSNGETTDSSDPSVVSENGNSSSSVVDAWSEVQEKALIQALKSFPKDSNQRWERVAESVPGKTLNQCKKKFTSLKEKFRNTKTA